MDCETQHFLLCGDDGRGVPRSTGEKLEVFRAHLRRALEVLPPVFDQQIPIIFTSTGKKRPFTPAFVEGLPLRTEAGPEESAKLTCVLVRSVDEALLGLTALALGKGKVNSLACTISLFATGYRDYLLYRGADGESGQQAKDLVNKEKELVLLGPLLNFRKAIAGMLTPAEYRSFAYSFVNFIISRYGFQQMLVFANRKVLNKGKESEDGLVTQLDDMAVVDLGVPIVDVEEAWKTELFAHQQENDGVEDYGSLPEEMRQLDCYAAVAVSGAKAESSAPEEPLALEAAAQPLLLRGPPGTDDSVVDVDPDAEAAALAPVVPSGIPLRNFSASEVLVWTYGWIKKNEPESVKRGMFCVAYLFTFSALYPFLLYWMFDRSVPDEDWGGFGGCLVGLTGGFLLQAQAEYLLKTSIPSGARFIPVLQLKLAKHMVNFPQEQLDKTTADDRRSYISVVESDVPCVSKNIDALFVGLSSCSQLLGALIILYFISPIQGAVVSFVLPLFYLYSEHLGYTMSTTSVLVRDFERKFVEAIEENFARSAIKRVFGLFHYLDGKLEDNGKEIATGYREFSSVAALNERGMQLLGMLMTFLVVIIGGILIIYDMISYGEFIAFYIGSATLSSHLVNITGCVNQFHASRIPLAALLAVLDTKSATFERASVFPPAETGLLVTNVSATKRDDVDRDEPVLKNVHLSFPAGHKIAVVEESGRGSSQLLKLCARMYSPDAGTITVNNVPLEQIDVPRTIAYVPERAAPDLFEGTIADNIRIGTNATEEQIEDAAVLANLHQDVMSLDRGYQSPVGFNGEGLSIVMIERVLLARAFVRQTPIILLDRPCCTQDPATVRKVGETLSKLQFTSGSSGGIYHSTVVVATNNVELIKDFDIVVMMENGQVMEYGSPAELTESRGKFWTMFVGLEGLSIDPITGMGLLSPARLRQIWPFAHVYPDNLLQKMMTNFITKDCFERETLYRANTEADTMFILIRGTVEEHVTDSLGRDKIVRIWQAGECVGVENLISATNIWETTALTAAGAMVVSLKRQAFQQIIASDPELGFLNLKPTLRKMAYFRSPMHFETLWPFVGLDDDDLELVCSYMTTSVYEENTVLFDYPSSPCSAMYVVVTGSLQLKVESFDAHFKRAPFYEMLKSGAVVGEAALFKHTLPDLLKARTTENSVLMTLRPEELQNLYDPSSRNRVYDLIQRNYASHRKYTSTSYLAENWLLSSLNSSVLAVISGLFRVRGVAKGSTILEATGKDTHHEDHCFIVVAGKVAVTVEGTDGAVSRYIAQEGDIFNEVAMIADGRTLGENILMAEADAVSIVASCSRAAFLSALSTLSITGPIRELAERRAAVKTEDYMAHLGLRSLSSADLSTLAIHSRSKVYALDHVFIPDPYSDSVVYTVLQGNVRILNKMGVKELGPGEAFRSIQQQTAGMPGEGESFVQQAVVCSDKAIVFEVNLRDVAPSNADRRLEEEAHLLAEHKVRRSNRSSVAELYSRIHAEEVRIGLTPRFAVIRKWRKALNLIRLALSLGLEDRIFDHTCFHHRVDVCRKKEEEIQYLKAFLGQLQKESSRRLALFEERCAEFKLLDQMPEDQVRLDTDSSDLTDERLSKIDAERAKLAAERKLRLQKRRDDIVLLWRRMKVDTKYLEDFQRRLEEKCVPAPLPEAFQMYDDEESRLRKQLLGMIVTARNHLKNLWPVLKVSMDKRVAFLPPEEHQESAVTPELVDAYEEEVRKLEYAIGVLKPIEFDPVKFHIALHCAGIREELGLLPSEDDPLERTTEQWESEVLGLQRIMAERNSERGGLVQQCKQYWELLGTPLEECESFLARHVGLRSDTLSGLESEVTRLRALHLTVKKERYKLVHQTYRLWNENGTKWEIQDKLLRKYDSVLPEALAAIKKEMDLQRAILAANHSMAKAAMMNDFLAQEAAAELIKKLVLEEAESRAALDAESDDMSDSLIEAETSEAQVLRRMEELSKLRDDKAARLIQSHMRGHRARIQMKVMREQMGTARKLWTLLRVAYLDQEMWLKKLSGLKLPERIALLREKITELRYAVEKKEAEDLAKEARKQELSDQRKAFGLFAKVAAYWEKLSVVEEERMQFVFATDQPVVLIMHRLHHLKDTLEAQFKEQIRAAEEDAAAQAAAIALANAQAAAQKKAGKKAGKKKKGKRDDSPPKEPPPANGAPPIDAGSINPTVGLSGPSDTMPISDTNGG
ncbi:hypothetical protein CYMTET_13287 [Cymbomonas tetramitiformis]|uniref:Uncharacterized protein n=1 Tax=Cymbomonas tetramitiformis TaxID=36881 RepID=A0AAE0GIS1_9CHLO|nr:hypothetical protein CYMTET_13287 [Cymbomonas tetramitiformis]